MEGLAYGSPRKAKSVLDVRKGDLRTISANNPSRWAMQPGRAFPLFVCWAKRNVAYSSKLCSSSNRPSKKACGLDFLRYPPLKKPWSARRSSMMFHTPRCTWSASSGC